MLAPAMMPEIDEMLITEPPSLWVCFLISATPCLHPRNTPSRSIAWTLRHSSSVMSSTVLLSPMPAELSSTWMAPNFFPVLGDARLPVLLGCNVELHEMTRRAQLVGNRLAAIGRDVGHH